MGEVNNHCDDPTTWKVLRIGCRVTSVICLRVGGFVGSVGEAEQSVGS